MHIDLTRHNSAWTLLLFSVLALIFGVHGGVAEPTATDICARSDSIGPAQMPLGAWIDTAGAQWPVLSGVITLLLVFWNGLLLTRALNRNMLLLERSYLPFILYLIVACGPAISTPAPFVAAALLVTACDLMLASFRRQANYTKSFDAALLMGLSVLFYAPAAWFALLLPTAMIVFRKGWREWITTTGGLVFPLLMASYIGWGMGQSFGHQATVLAEVLQRRITGMFWWQAELDPVLLFFGGLILLATLVSMALFIARSGMIRTRPYKTGLYFFWTFLFSLLLVFLPGTSWNDLPLLAIAPAVLLPVGLDRLGRPVANTAYLLLLLSILVYCFLPLAGR